MSNPYFEKMKPYAEKASRGTGIPVSVILAQWAHESAYGGSYGAKNRNNHAGISNFTGKPYNWSKAYKVDPRPSNEGGWYNVYKNIDDFVDDYIHVMNLNYYDEVRKAGQTPQIEDDVLELGKSPFAGNHYVKNGVPGGSIMAMIKSNNLTVYDSRQNDDGLYILKENVKKNPNESLMNKDQGLAIFTGAVALTLIGLLSD